MQNNKLPKIMQQYVKDMTCIKDKLGCSEASVYYFINNNNSLYLKVEKINPEFEHEQKVMQWLQERLHVPRIIAQCRELGYEYLLMTNVVGDIACSEQHLNNPRELVRLLATGIKILQAVDIYNCPFDCKLKNKKS